MHTETSIAIKGKFKENFIIWEDLLVIIILDRKITKIGMVYVINRFNSQSFWNFENKLFYFENVCVTKSKQKKDFD